MTDIHDHRHVAIVGGGASGVLVATHLLLNARSVSISLIERQCRFGSGIAYGTEHPEHLLNVRAMNMSAFPDDPDHFSRWMCEHPTASTDEPFDRLAFLPRRLYGDYLRSVLDEASSKDGKERLRFLSGEAVDIVATAAGHDVILGDGRRLTADIVVLATGNEGMPMASAGRHLDAWNMQAISAIPRSAPIVIVGTGLTMADQVLSLLHAGHEGTITAISRRGLTNHAHLTRAAATIPRQEIPFGSRLSHLCRWLRARVRSGAECGTDWREVVDGIRPHTREIWQALRVCDRKRFLRHLRPWWDIHRHRMAPRPHRIIDQAVQSGALRIVPARVVGFREKTDAIDVSIIPRGSSKIEVISASAVLECRGRSNANRTENPALRSMLQRGSLRPDALGLGIDVTEACAVIDANGTEIAGLYAVGPITAGTFWETVAVPDIRLQAAALVRRLLDTGAPEPVPQR
jgi:uncharacterized NAD(P)/FAD-binding protein YdhS